MKKKLEELVAQKFPHRCPYCEQMISYDQFDLKTGENEIECPSCKKIYIKVVHDSDEDGISSKSQNLPSLGRRGKEGGGKSEAEDK